MSGGLSARVRGRVDREYRDRRARALIRATGARTTTAGPAVALTFDDGPMPGSTDRVLDVLADLDVRATFFCVGANARRHPALLRRIAEEGHSVGSHSMTHPHPKDLTPRQVRREYVAGRDAVEQALGAPAPLFRPPHGHLSPGTVATLHRRRPWLWSCDPEDWRPDASRARIEASVSAARPGDVVLLHDWVEEPEGVEALDRTPTVEAIPAAVAALRARGIDFCRLVP